MPTEDRDELRVVLEEMTDEMLTTSDEVDSVIGLAVPGWMFIATAPSMACIGLGAALDDGLGVRGPPLEILGAGLVLFPALGCLGLLRLVVQGLWARRTLRRQAGVVLRTNSVPAWADALQVIISIGLTIAVVLSDKGPP